MASYPLVVVRTRFSSALTCDDTGLLRLFSVYLMIVWRFPRLMAQGMPGRPVKYQGSFDCFKTIFREEGIRGLYRGQIPGLMKTIPSVSIGYAVYDLCRSMLGMPTMT